MRLALIAVQPVSVMQHAPGAARVCSSTDAGSLVCPVTTHQHVVEVPRQHNLAPQPRTAHTAGRGRQQVVALLQEEYWASEAKMVLVTSRHDEAECPRQVNCKTS